jgi:hypothetical protein
MDLADPQQWNAYAYSNNSPVTFSDPTGLWCDSCNNGNGWDQVDEMKEEGGRLLGWCECDICTDSVMDLQDPQQCCSHLC